jgi:hypothetical protein
MGMRTHVTLTETQRDFLLSESARSGLSMAELVRRALDATYRFHRAGTSADSSSTSGCGAGSTPRSPVAG